MRVHGRRYRLGRNKRRQRQRFAFEVMEPRELLATFTVTTTADDGAGSLRQAITGANITPGADLINFAIPMNDSGFTPATTDAPASWTIRPMSPLPEIRRDPSTPTTPNPLTIDATTQPGFGDRPIIQIDGTNAGAGADGLLISAGDCTVKGLVINQFQLLVSNGVRTGGNGIRLTTNGNDVIQGNYLGLDVSAVKRVGNGDTGITIDSSPNNLIGGTGPGQGNLLSSNRTDGLFIKGAGATGNVVQGNTIGTNFQSDSSGDLANLIDGVEIDGASGNLIGGTAPGAGNVISRNSGNGVSIRRSSSTGNVVQGNYIGTDPSGNRSLGNLLDGVFIEGGVNNLIGGTDPAARNVIGRNRIGVDIQPFTRDPVNPPSDATGNAVQGNFIGLGLDPFNNTVRLDNLTDGIAIGGSRNLIGGTEPNAGNVISRNGANGISIAGRTLSPVSTRFGVGNVVQGNKIGTDPTGSTSFSNAQNGIVIDNSDSNPIGPGNLIAGNAADGVVILSPLATKNVVQGNLIGTDGSGTRALGNSGLGVRIDGAGGNTIGGATEGKRNIISGNLTAGVAIFGSGGANNLILGNYIGPDINGRTGVGNRQDGVTLASGAAGNVVGGTTPGARNLISGNLGNGVGITNGASGNQIQGNYIGVDATGAARLANSGNGVLINDSGGNTIGGAADGAGNVITGNQFNGVFLSGLQASGNQVQGNLIGIDSTGTRGLDPGGSPLGNVGSGVLVSDAPNNLIGGTLSTERNVISGNLSAGVQLFNSAATGNKVEGNYIGTNRAGTAPLGNLADGVLINFAPANTIGGPVPAAGNLISGNQASGIHLQGARSTANVLEANVIGLDASGLKALGNSLQGVQLDDAPANQIGIAAAGLGNVISGNAGSGILINGVGASGNLIRNNTIGTDATGLVLQLGNQIHGIFLNGITGTLIGGTGSLDGNLISGNVQDGVLVANLPSAPSGLAGPLNTIQRNMIGTDRTGNGVLPNSENGVAIDNAILTLVGGEQPGTGNWISGNLSAGILISGNGAHDNRVAGNTIGTNISGEKPLGNVVGVLLNGAPGNFIGGTSEAASNLISGNQQAGIQIVGFGAMGNLVRGNQIGIDAGNQAPLSNGIGVVIDNVSSNTIGGPEAGAGNTISGNSTAGVYIFGQSATNNVVAGNIIGLDKSGRTLIASSTSTDANIAVQVRQNVGVLINGSVGNLVGGVARNTISGNVVGVELSSLNANLPSVDRPNRVLGNLIGTDSTGLVAQGNLYGVFINGLSGNVIGGPGAGNVISGNILVGVEIVGSFSTGNLIQGNLIGLGLDGKTTFPPTASGRNARFVQQIGVGIQNASKNTIGGTAAGESNVIAGNDQAGVYILGRANSSQGNVIRGNAIGLKLGKGRAIGNRLYGVLLFNASDNEVDRSGRGANRFAANGIADFREYTGPQRGGNTIDTVPVPGRRAGGKSRQRKSHLSHK